MTLRVLSVVAKLRHRHGAPIENLMAWPPGRGNHGRYRLTESLKVVAPSPRPRSKPGEAPCRCHEMREGVCCPPCTMRESWRSGRYRRSRKSVRWDVWQPIHDQFLRGLVGKSEPEMTAAFERDFHHPRTGHAIRKRMLELGLSTHQEGMTCQALSRLFCIDADRILGAWIRTGLMAGVRGEPARHAKRADKRRNGWWRVSEVEVERFIRAYPWEYDWRTMDPSHRLTAVAREVARREPYLSIKEAARTLGIAPAEVSRMVREGKLPAKRVTPVLGRNPHGVRILAADVAALCCLRRAS